jgi:hypothetical protein
LPQETMSMRHKIVGIKKIDDVLDHEIFCDDRSSVVVCPSIQPKIELDNSPHTLVGTDEKGICVRCGFI